MEITLFKARCIMTELETIINSIDNSPEVNISKFSENAWSSLQKCVNDFENSIQRKLKVVNAFYEIRKAVVDKNATCGIAIIENDVLRMQKIIDIKKEILKQRACKTNAEIQKEIESLLNSSQEYLHSSVLDGNYIKNTEEEIKFYRRIQISLTDNIIELSTTNTIMLSGETQETLSQEGIL